MNNINTTDVRMKAYDKDNHNFRYLTVNELGSVTITVDGSDAATKTNQNITHDKLDLIKKDTDNISKKIDLIEEDTNNISKQIDSIEPKIINCDTNNIKISLLENIGEINNLCNNISLNNTDVSNIVDITNINIGNIYYKDSNISSSNSIIEIEVTPDSTNYISYDTLIPYLSINGTYRKDILKGLNLQGFVKLRIKNSSGIQLNNVESFIVGTP